MKREVDSHSGCVKFIPSKQELEFQEMKKEINSLRKEVNKLKKSVNKDK